MDDNTIDWLLNVCPYIWSHADDRTTTPQTKEGEEELIFKFFSTNQRLFQSHSNSV